MNTQAIKLPAVPTPAPVPSVWWREPMMWLVVGGPLTVVVAGFATLAIAISVPDPVVADDYYRRGLEINKEMALKKQADAALATQPVPGLAPAMQARNHAATPAPAPTPAPSVPAVQPNAAR